MPPTNRLAADGRYFAVVKPEYADLKPIADLAKEMAAVEAKDDCENRLSTRYAGELPVDMESSMGKYLRVNAGSKQSRDTEKGST